MAFIARGPLGVSPATIRGSRKAFQPSGFKITSTTAARSAVLERPQQTHGADEVVAAPNSELLNGDFGYEHKFWEYQSATLQLQELENLSNQLLSNLEELNSAVVGIEDWSQVSCVNTCNRN